MSINVHFEEAELLIVYISNFRRLSKETAKRFIKQMSLSTYPDIRDVQKKLRKSVYQWVYFDKPIDYNRLIALASAVRNKAEVEAKNSVPKS